MANYHNIDRLLEIMAALRTAGTGCPWDLKQDFSTIAPYTIEEAYEVADAIEREDMDDLRLELGDLLLQSVYHARMAEEAGHFDFGDVVEGICNKMIRRHPHVFGDEDGTAEEYSAKGLAKGTWERIKAEEKQEAVGRREKLGLPPKGISNSILDDVPTKLPPMMSATKLQKKASKVGFDWNDPHAVLDKIREETNEIEEELNRSSTKKARIADEIGDLLFAVVNLARHLEIDPESALRNTNSKFRRRFAYVEENISEKTKSLQSAGLEQMEELWANAKSKEKASAKNHN